MYYQGRDGGKPPSLHYTPLKHEGSKTMMRPKICFVRHYTPLKHEGSKTIFLSDRSWSLHYTPLKHETPPENAKKPLSAQTCADRGFSCSLYTI